MSDFPSMLVSPVHSREFLLKHGLGVEILAGPTWTPEKYREYEGLIQGIHLPFTSDINLAAIDQEARARSISILKAAMEQALIYKVPLMVIHSGGFEQLNLQHVGEYELMIRSFHELSDFASRHGITLCLENMMLREPWTRHLYGDSAKEWFQIYRDIGRDNVMLTFDSSHAAAGVAHLKTMAERCQALYEYLEHPELIARIHWSDARLVNSEAHWKDMHLVPGFGDLPRDFHRRIKALPALKTLEQKHASDEATAAGLDFIASL